MLQPKTFKTRKVALSVSPPTTNTIPSTELNSDTFDEVIDDKSYRVIYEKAVICPCKTPLTHDAQPSCRNCGGQGWVFVNPINAKFLIQGVSKSKSMGDLAEWAGTFQVTPRAHDDITLGYMDRITLSDTFAEHSEQVVAKPVSISGTIKYVAFLTYMPKKVVLAYKYVAVDQPLEIIDASTLVFDTAGRYVEFPSAGQYSFRYEHEVQMTIISISRDVRYSNKLTSEGVISQRFPQSAMGRRLHQQFDPIPFIGDGLFDNSTT